MMIEDYSQRWHIETLFGCLRSRGFDLEVTHITELDHMDKLMGILALAFTWCLLTGQQHHGEAKHLPLNRYYRPAKSLFKLELDMLRRVLLNAQSKHDSISFLLLLKVLFRTWILTVILCTTLQPFLCPHDGGMFLHDKSG